MPTGPKGQKRPADVIGNAVRVMQIATGEREEEYEGGKAKSPAAQEIGRIGGRKRAESMTPEARSDAARRAAKAKRAKRKESPVPSERE